MTTAIVPIGHYLTVDFFQQWQYAMWLNYFIEMDTRPKFQCPRIKKGGER